ncbi:MAG: hypothetical protein WED00_15265 [Aquisalimonadaceae bacterium]
MSDVKDSALRIWRWPLVLGAISGLGLVTALLGDGLWDVLSWIALGAVALVCGWFSCSGRAGLG